MAKKKGSKKRALEKAREEEEARRLAEELERQRVSREQHEREEQERLKQEEMERRGREIDEYYALLGYYAKEVRETKRSSTYEIEWTRFLSSGKHQPDPTNLHDMNFLVTRWRDRHDYGDRQALFQTMDMCFWSMNIMQERLWGAIEYRWSEQTMTDLLDVFDQMCATMLVKLDLATYHALENYNKLVDPKTEVVSTEYTGNGFTFALWSPAGQQLMVAPDSDGFFSLANDNFRFEFPKSIGTSVALRYLHLPFEVFCQEGTNHLFRALWRTQTVCFDNDKIAMDEPVLTNNSRVADSTGGTKEPSIKVVASDMSNVGGALHPPTKTPSLNTKSAVGMMTPSASKTNNNNANLKSATSMPHPSSSPNKTLPNSSPNMTSSPAQSPQPVAPIATFVPSPADVLPRTALKDELEAFVEQEEQNVTKFGNLFAQLTRHKSAFKTANSTDTESDAEKTDILEPLTKAALQALSPTKKSPNAPINQPRVSPKSDASTPSTDVNSAATTPALTTGKSPNNKVAGAPAKLGDKSATRPSSTVSKKADAARPSGKKKKGKRESSASSTAPQLSVVKDKSPHDKPARDSSKPSSKNPSPSSGMQLPSDGHATSTDASETSDTEDGSKKLARVASDVELVAPDLSGGSALTANPTTKTENDQPRKPRSLVDERRVSSLPVEDFINLQNNIAVGGVHAIELFELPPLPSRVKGIEIFLIDNEPHLQKVSFNTPQLTAELEALDDEIAANVEAKRKFLMDNSIGLRMAVPENRLRLYGNSVIAMWNEKHRHWSASGLIQAVYKKGVIDLRVSTIAPICLFQSKWVGLPFKSWRLIPKRLHNVWLYLESSAPESIVIEFGETGQCRLHAPKSLDISLQWLQPNQLIHALIARGIYIFPGLDDDATLAGLTRMKQMPPRKLLQTEMKAYIAIAATCSVYEFTHSMWNPSAEFASEEIVVQYRPADWWSDIRVQPPSDGVAGSPATTDNPEDTAGTPTQQATPQSEGAAIIVGQAPPASTLDPAKLYQQPERLYFRGHERRLCLVSSARSMTLNMKEHDVQFSRLPSSPFHPDAYHLLFEQVGTSKPDLLNEMVRAPLFFSAVYSFLVLTRVLSFTYNA